MSTVAPTSTEGGETDMPSSAGGKWMQGGRWGRVLAALAIILGVSCGVPLPAVAQPATSRHDSLNGLWQARGRFGPDAYGPLLIQKYGGAYVADMVGRRVPVHV